MSDDFKGRGQSPWGSPPGGGGNGSGRGPTPPDIDAIIRDIQNKINKFLPGGSKSGGKPIGLILIILVLVWLASGLYRVLPDEQGVVLRFGKFVKTTQPGLNYHILQKLLKLIEWILVLDLKEIVVFQQVEE